MIVVAKQEDRGEQQERIGQLEKQGQNERMPQLTGKVVKVPFSLFDKKSLVCRYT